MFANRLLAPIEQRHQAEAVFAAQLGRRRTNQVGAKGTDPDGQVMFASLGATGHHRDGLEGQYENRPEVESPERAPEWGGPLASRAELAGSEPPPIPPEFDPPPPPPVPAPPPPT